MKQLLIPLIRFFKNQKRPSSAHNHSLLRERNENLASIKLREATKDDIKALAALHVKTWNDTYPEVRKPPTIQTREWQWKEAFAKDDGCWFCFVLENSKHELIGFAMGQQHRDPLEYKGQLSKIYLLKEYQRLGLGKKLFCAVVRRFEEMDIHSMLLFAEATNPSIYFYQSMGGERLGDSTCGNYGWKDLSTIIRICDSV